MLHIVVLLFTMLLNAPTIAANPCPATDTNADWAASCFEADEGGRRVKPQYVKRLRLDSGGFTTIVIDEPRELVAVNRQGKVVVPGIRHTGDFDFQDAERGIGRFETPPFAPGSKVKPRCGYFDSRDFRIVVPAEYTQCQPFANGEAIACKNCVKLCTTPECQDSMLMDGEGVALGFDGTVRERFKLPDQKAVCASAGSKESKACKYKGTQPHCILKTYNPFK